MKKKLAFVAICLGITIVTGPKSLAQLDSDYQRQIPAQQLEQNKKAELLARCRLYRDKAQFYMNPGYIYIESGKNIFYTPGLGTVPQHYCGYIGKLGVEFTANTWMTPNCPPGMEGTTLCATRFKYMLKIENGQLARYSRNLTKGGAVERYTFTTQLSSAIPGGDTKPSMNSSVTEVPSTRKYPLDCGKQPSKEQFVMCMKNI